MIEKILRIGIIILLIPGLACEKDDEKTYKFEELEEEVLSAINAYRISQGLSSLNMNSFIRNECRTHSENMADGTVSFGHEGFLERSDRIIAELGSGNISENVAVGSETAEAVVNSWINSSAHKTNIEGDYNLTGVGIAENSDGVLYFTQIFFKSSK
ncbi:MAG: CAP domain-containing protein [Bacteroidales bacterium]|nr:MAG: CAP domain-containing protein [Bacteroidales bacterium]